jgi:xylulokinase
MLATVLNMPLDLPAQGEFGAALGAARLAICGVTGQSPEQVMTKPAIQTTVSPRADLVAAYDTSYARFAASFPTLKALQ